MTLEESVIQQGIARDAAYAARLASDLSDRRYASFASVVSPCLVPYLSLFVHESYRKLKRLIPHWPRRYRAALTRSWLAHDTA
jgi:hypothetical protein